MEQEVTGIQIDRKKLKFYDMKTEFVTLSFSNKIVIMVNQLESLSHLLSVSLENPNELLQTIDFDKLDLDEDPTPYSSNKSKAYEEKSFLVKSKYLLGNTFDEPKLAAYHSFLSDIIYNAILKRNLRERRPLLLYLNLQKNLLKDDLKLKQFIEVCKLALV